MQSGQDSDNSLQGRRPDHCPRVTAALCLARYTRRTVPPLVLRARVIAPFVRHDHQIHGVRLRRRVGQVRRGVHIAAEEVPGRISRLEWESAHNASGTGLKIGFGNPCTFYFANSDKAHNVFKSCCLAHGGSLSLSGYFLVHRIRILMSEDRSLYSLSPKKEDPDE